MTTFYDSFVQDTFWYNPWMRLQQLEREYQEKKQYPCLKNFLEMNQLRKQISILRRHCDKVSK